LNEVNFDTWFLERDFSVATLAAAVFHRCSHNRALSEPRDGNLRLTPRSCDCLELSELSQGPRTSCCSSPRA
jgi:hypothetical protein